MEHLNAEMIREKGRLGWQKAGGYGRRSLRNPPCPATRQSAVVAFAQTLPAQKIEARVGCSVLNRITRLDMPVSQRIA